MVSGQRCTLRRPPSGPIAQLGPSRCSRWRRCRKTLWRCNQRGLPLCPCRSWSAPWWWWWWWWSTSSPVSPIGAPVAEPALALGQHKTPTARTFWTEGWFFWCGGFCWAPVISDCTGCVWNFHAEQAWPLILYLLQVNFPWVVRFIILPKIQNWKHQCLCRRPPWSDRQCCFLGRSASAGSLPGSPPSSESWVVPMKIWQTQALTFPMFPEWDCFQQTPALPLPSPQPTRRRRTAASRRLSLNNQRPWRSSRSEKVVGYYSISKLGTCRPGILVLRCSTSCLYDTHTSPEMILNNIWVRFPRTWILAKMCLWFF